jgi:anti-sigma factor ChrR (cupin superfamily)
MLNQPTKLIPKPSSNDLAPPSIAPGSKPLIFDHLLNDASAPSLPWEPFRPGIDIARIYVTGPDGPSAAFLRYAPGASLPRHEHRGFEHILILAGSQIDDHGKHPTGTLIVHPPGTSHTITSIEGCIVLAIWEKPVTFLTE